MRGIWVIFPFLSVFLALVFGGCASSPTPQSIQADLLRVQADVQTLAASSAPLVQSATGVADVVEGVSGNAGLIPLTNAVSQAVQAAGVAAGAVPVVAPAVSPVIAPGASGASGASSG
jgi:hypothetical protein